MKNKAIFLDRDGVLNNAIVKKGKPFPPENLEQITIAPDVFPALQLMKALGYLLIGATNQPDVARGTTARSWVEEINQRLLQTLPLDDIRVCYHDDQDACDCRKPMPGLLLSAAKHYEINLRQSIMIGDRWKDIEAGQRAGCKTIWIDRGYQECRPKIAPDIIVRSLMPAALWLQKLNY